MAYHARTTVAFCNEKIEVYVAKDLIPSRQHLDEDEFIDLKAYSLDDLKEKIFSGEIEDAKTVASLMAYAAKNTENKRRCNKPRHIMKYPL